MHGDGASCGASHASAADGSIEIGEARLGWTFLRLALTLLVLGRRQAGFTGATAAAATGRKNSS